MFYGLLNLWTWDCIGWLPRGRAGAGIQKSNGLLRNRTSQYACFLIVGSIDTMSCKTVG